MTNGPRVRRVFAGLLAVVGLPSALLWYAFTRPVSTPARPDAAAASDPALASPPSTDSELTQAAANPPPPAVVGSAVANPEPDLEEAQLSELRRLALLNPGLAVTQARLQERQFPNSERAAERSSILIHALANAGRSSEARGTAEDVVNRYPDSDWVREIEAFTGAHRHRTARLNADGEVTFD